MLPCAHHSFSHPKSAVFLRQEEVFLNTGAPLQRDSVWLDHTMYFVLNQQKLCYFEKVICALFQFFTILSAFYCLVALVYKRFSWIFLEKGFWQNAWKCNFYELLAMLIYKVFWKNLVAFGLLLFPLPMPYSESLHQPPRPNSYYLKKAALAQGIYLEALPFPML